MCFFRKCYNGFWTRIFAKSNGLILKRLKDGFRPSDYYQCWKQSCCTIFLWKLWYINFFRIHRRIENSKEQKEIFSYIINVFIVTFDQFSASLLNKSRILLTPKFFQVIFSKCDLLNIWRCWWMCVCVAVRDGPWPLLQTLICLSSTPHLGWFITGETLQANGLLMKLLVDPER